MERCFGNYLILYGLGLYEMENSCKSDFIDSWCYVKLFYFNNGRKSEFERGVFAHLKV